VGGSYWQRWHGPYDQPGSFLARRLRVVQDQIATALTSCPPGTVRVVSACAGEGRDVLGVLANHPRRGDVVARLVEMDPGIAEVAMEAASPFQRVEVVRGDAGITDAYRGAVPADIVLMCGVFGNITDGDIEATIGALPQLCAAGAVVIWTRHRRPLDRTTAIREWLERGRFEELSFVAPDDSYFSVGAHRFVGDPEPLQPGLQLFTFVDGATGHV
jgi:hypothetical protein